MHRRKFLIGIGLKLGLLSGCLGNGREGTRTPEPEPRTTTFSPTPTPTSTATERVPTPTPTEAETTPVAAHTWTAYQANNRRTGFTASFGPKSAENKERIQLGGTPVGGPIVGPSYIYLGTASGSIIRIQRDSNFSKQVLASVEGKTSTPTLANDRLYLLGDDLYALNPASGDIHWTFSLNKSPQGTASVDEHVFVSDSQSVYKLTPDGEKSWRATAPFNLGEVTMSAVDGQNVYVGKATGVECLSRDRGNRQWEAQIGGAVQAVPSVGNDYVLAGTDGGKLVAIDKQSGEVNWEYQTEVAIKTSVAIAGQYVFLVSKRLHKLHAKSGKHFWTTEISGDPITYPPAIADGVVYIASDNGEIHAIRTDDGNPIWKATTEDFVAGPPAIASGNLYVTDRAGNLYSFS